MSAELKIQQEIDKLNNFCNQLAVQTAEDIKLSMLRYTSENATGESINRIKGKATEKGGECYKISYNILRYNVFFHKGVGKGRGINSGKATPKPFLNKPFEKSAEKLSKFVTENLMDRIVNISKGELV